MKNQQNKTNRGTKKFPLFTYFCLLVAVATMCTGATFARYVTSSQGGANVGVAHLACSFSVDEVSSTAFSNSDYWVTIEGQQYTQNHPREIIFSLHNYDKNADGIKSSPSEIDLQSTFRFFAPKELLENVAFQILKKGDGNTRIPLTQQYVMPKIIQSVTGGQTSLSTADFKDGSGNPLDYGEYTGRPEETLALTKLAFDGDNGTGKFVAQAQIGSENVATLALTAEKHENVSYETTHVRGNEIQVDDKKVNDMTAPEYYSVYQASKMIYYCLDITLPSMTMKAVKNADGTFKAVDDQYIFAFTIIAKHEFNETDTKIAEHFNVSGVSLYSNSACTDGDFLRTATIKVYNTLEGGTVKSTKYSFVDGLTETECTLEGNTITLKDLDRTQYFIKADTVANLNDPTWNPYANDKSYKIDPKAVRKVYRTDMRVLFTQASQTGGN